MENSAVVGVPIIITEGEQYSSKVNDDVHQGKTRILAALGFHF